MSAACEKWIDGLQFSSLFWPPPQDEQHRQVRELSNFVSVALLDCAYTSCLSV